MCGWSQACFKTMSREKRSAAEARIVSRPWAAISQSCAAEVRLVSRPWPCAPLRSEWFYSSRFLIQFFCNNYNEIKCPHGPKSWIRLGLCYINPLSTDSRTVRLKPELLQDHEPRKAMLQLKPGLFQDHEPRKALHCSWRQNCFKTMSREKPELCSWSQACFKTMSRVWAAHGLETSLTSAAQQDSP